MTTARAWRTVVLTACALALSGANALGPYGHARASTVEGLSLTELTARADLIVVGEVLWQEAVVSRDGTITTWSRLRVERRLRGDVLLDEVVVETLGGEVGRIGMQVEGEPGFRVGERVVVFGRRGDRLRARPVGMAQGVMRVRVERGEEFVAPSRAGLILLKRNAQGALVKSEGPLAIEESLEAFWSRVGRIVASQDATNEPVEGLDE
ncbi:MAG: hypothetical protein AAF436_17355 [Myxococcota bacterium]